MYALRHYFSFYADKDTRLPLVAPDEYRCEIHEFDYLGSATEIEATESPNQVSVQNLGDNKLLALIGSEATMNLIATVNFALQSLYTENERQFLVILKRNGSVVWRHFIIPDNCTEPFTFPPYPINVNCVDGLGLLKNFSFVLNDGTIYIGKMTFIEVIYACLSRLGIPDMVLNTCVNIYEITMTQGDAFDPLDMCYVNAERYFKPDGFTPMDCQEVLMSVLQEWTASIIQSEGEWWIFRPNEVALSGDLVFRRYVDGQRAYDIPTISKNIDVLLGGESEGEVLAPLFHINQDQQTMIDRAFKNASISYRYGFLASLIVNPQFTGWNGIVFPDWTRSNPAIDLSEDPLGGAKLGNITPSPGPYEYIVTGTPAGGTIGDILTFQLAFYNYISDGPNWQIKLTNGVTDYWLLADGSWTTSFTNNANRSPTLYNFESSLTVQTQPLPITGDLTIYLYEASDDFGLSPSTDLFITYRRADLVPFIDPDDPIGEIHTATNSKTLSFIPDTLNVFNGDDITESHVGAIYRDDQTTLTTLWNRRGLPESVLALPYEASKSFLRIAVEETVRLHGSQFIRYEGSVFGYFNPLSRFTVNLLDGKFIPLSIRYDFQSNVHKVVLGRVSNEEIAMEYTLLSDFGDTTKVTIR